MAVNSDTQASKLGIAFALVCLAGLCAPLGASVVVFMHKHHTGLLAGSIALAAGVMVFVSLTEVLGDSIEELSHGGWNTAVIHAFTYLAFFGGVALCRLLDWFADALMAAIAKFTRRRRTNGSSNDLCAVHIDDAAPVAERQLCSIPPDRHEGGHPSHREDDKAHIVVVRESQEGRFNKDTLIDGADVAPAAAHTGTEPAVVPGDQHELVIAAAVEQLGEEDCAHLVRTSIMVWLALSLHNLPEGLATIVGYMSSPHLGVTVAVAIAIHNIPEGIALGVPVFFATGSRWKAIGWAAASGVAEPLGSLIGLALQLTGQLSPVAMGIIMATVAGVMTGIAFQELLPRAISFDPANKWTTRGVFVGMGIMAVSMVLLSLWDTSV